MTQVLTAGNSEALRLLGTRACARLGLQAEVVLSGRDMLARARELQPRAVILEEQMADLSGLEVCRRIKDDPELAHCRVMLVVRGILRRPLLERVNACGCDDVLMLPALGEELVSHLATLMGVPRRQARRVRAEVMAQVSSGSRRWPAVVVNLSTRGARLRLEEPLAGVAALRVRFDAGPGRAVVVAAARVVWRAEAGHLVGVDFGEVGALTRTQLAALARWEVVEEEGVQRVFMAGDLTEDLELEPLAARLRGRVEFDAARVRHVNSRGTRRWIAFLASLVDVSDYSFACASVAFATQAAVLVDFLGRGTMRSFMAPYHCDGCGHDEEHLLQAAALATGGGPITPPRFPCPRCQGELTFDELPERYFAFLGRE